MAAEENETATVKDSLTVGPETEEPEVETDEEVELDKATEVVSDGDEDAEPVIIEGEALERRFESPLRGVRKLHERALERRFGRAELVPVEDDEDASEAQEAVEANDTGDAEE